jgi:hypothetical protein
MIRGGFKPVYHELFTLEDKRVKTRFLRFGEYSASVDCGIDSSLNLTTCMTFEAWIKTSDSGNIASRWWTRGNNRAWWVNISSGKLRAHVSSNGVINSTTHKEYITTASVNTNNWVHIAFTFRQNELKLFINGVEAEVTKTADHTVNSLHSVNARMFLGCFTLDNITGSGGALGLFNGDMDEVRIWNVCRTPSEIRQFYNKAAPRFDRRLAAYYSCDAGSGTTLADDSVNTNTGTLDNVTFEVI